ncbi:SET domain-containing protein [Saitoella complicata NRRL Y-17804]|uniref:SET domain-containing protein n=1 Tax=Saitoella complicata (strain BCRC 22490 / CBS 7301 / JCM 7358 / NBRC 10748 / NRRL Y-17804) TaxID=698492 RepID=UPI000866FC27|nr:SET domain-containing protein [Saitoella complicata NRRL Y-17804]ODQ52361.1 SET domain-containing protein [Saitoella complicata NRRL Y-17804]
MGSTLDSAQCVPLEVFNDQGKGRGIRSAEAIEEGKCILKLTPAIAVLDDAHLNNTCSGCFALPSNPLGGTTAGSLLRCSGCQIVRYCSKNCQRSDWPNHKLECPVFRSQRPRVLPTAVRAVMRILRLPRDGEVWNGFQGLMSHRDEVKEAGGPKEEMVTLFSRAAKEYSEENELDIASVESIFSTFISNCLSLLIASFDEVGLTADPLVCLLNHSCSPNAAVVFENKVLTIRSVRAISPKEEITISYVNHLQRRDIRRRELKEKWFFSCECAACARDESENARDPRECFTCANCRKLIPPPLKSEHSTEKLACPSCNKAQRFSWAELEKKEEKTLAISEDRKMRARRTPLLPLYYHTFNVALNEQDFLAAFRHSIYIHTALRLNSDRGTDLDPVAVVQTFAAAKLASYLASEPEQLVDVIQQLDLLKLAWLLLVDADMVVGMTHGDGSRFAKQVRAVKDEHRVNSLGLDGGRFCAESEQVLRGANASEEALEEVTRVQALAREMAARVSAGHCGGVELNTHLPDTVYLIR